MRSGDDSLGLLLGLLDDSFALGVDPLRRADLFGDGDAQLVDEAKRGGLVDDDVVRKGKAPAVRDDRLEALDEEDDVDRSGLRWRVGSARGVVGGDYRMADDPRRLGAAPTSNGVPTGGR